MRRWSRWLWCEWQPKLSPAMFLAFNRCSPGTFFFIVPCGNFSIYCYPFSNLCTVTCSDIGIYPIKVQCCIIFELGLPWSYKPGGNLWWQCGDQLIVDVVWSLLGFLPHPASVQHHASVRSTVRKKKGSIFNHIVNSWNTTYDYSKAIIVK